MVGDIREATAFPGLELVLRVHREVRVKHGSVRRVTRYIVTSLSVDEFSQARLLYSHFPSSRGVLSLLPDSAKIALN